MSQYFIYFVSVTCARLSWPSRQLLSAHKYRPTVLYRIDASKALKVEG